MGTNSSSLVTGGESDHHHHHHHHHQQQQQHHHHRSQWLPPPLPPSTSTCSYRLGVSATSDHLSVLAKDKKRKIAGFATLRKKLAMRRRRSSKSFDHVRTIRDFLSEWTPRELHALVEEYEAISALRELVVQAEAARPPAPAFQQDLSGLYDYKYCTDVELIFRGASFPAHRAILSVRCPYFRDLLARHSGHGTRVAVDVRTSVMDCAMFSSLLRFLYTGQVPSTATRLHQLDVLMTLGDEFGTPNILEQDLRHLLDTGEYADAVLVFTSDVSFQSSVGGVVSTCSPSESSSAGVVGGGCQGEYGFSTAPRLELPCHKAILSARSPFFRNLIQRRARCGEETTERALRTPTRIVLDESVIPKRYARVLLHAIYLDTVELTGILRASPSNSSLSEVQAMVAGRSHHPSLIDEAMEIYQIGRFLELDVLAQGCEDIIADNLTVENVVGVLKWSEQPHGSAWVHRQATHYLREEFQAVAASSVVLEMDRSHLAAALQSDYLQASELEVLQAVLKWGEHQLIRRMEEREPNLLSHTAHSVTKKGVKKRDLNDNELRDVLADLLPLVRVPHILPPDHELAIQSARRRLITIPPTHALLSDDMASVGHRVSWWIRSPNNASWVKPRLFMPYVDEVKVMLEERMVQESELVRLRHVRMSHIPDTLYMVEEKAPAQYSTASVDVVAGAIPVPDPDTLRAMLKREAELRQTPSWQRAYSLLKTNRADIGRQIQLRVVREFNLPDAVAEVLQSASYFYSEAPVDTDVRLPSTGTFLCSNRPNYDCVQTYIGSFSPYRGVQGETSNCGDGHLSDIMPDIAMATASLSQLGFQDGEMELDLGDRGNHSATMFL